MPCKVKTTMEQKVEFISAWRTQKQTITELCKSFEISRTTAYRMIDRFEKFGLEGLIERTKTPKSHPSQTSDEVVKNILNWKEKKPLWGAKKIRILLFKNHLEEDVPSVVTVHNILKKNGLVKPQKRHKRIQPINPIFDPKKCNEIWSADYKGKFYMGNKKYCHTLTVADSKSRYIFSAKGHYHENTKNVKTELTRIFRIYGIPQQLHTDNGSPFGSAQSQNRFTKLSYWLIDLGIMPVYSDPGRPDQNGRHERMHRDLKAACARPSAYDLKAQQRSLNRFIKEYDHERPHEALEMKTPGEIHTYSTRPFPEKIRDFDYDSDMKVQVVTQNGALRWGSKFWVYLTVSLKGKYVGLRNKGNGIWEIYYRSVFLGFVDEKSRKENETSIKLYQ